VILEVLVGAGLVMAGAAAARVLLRRRQQVEGTASTGKKPEAGELGGPRGLRIGDVLLYADTELWLAGLIELDEEGLVARLFPTPGALRAEWVAQLDPTANDLATLRPTDDVPAGPVPESLPISGRRLTLERRGHAVVRAEGDHLPRTTGHASYCLLSDAGGRIALVVDFDKAPRLALVGDRVPRHLVDLLPGGDLESSS
jgi:hypothetical protein